jgi:hypothetical protein
MSSFPYQAWRCHISHQFTPSSFQLTATEVKSLLQLKEARRTPQGVAKRAQIVLSVHAHPDWSSNQLAQSLRLDARLIEPRGDDAGTRRIRCKMPPGREGPADFPRRCERK